ncbi:MAG TPA: DNA-3-methyladenine glycosylase I [Candidatus Jorgensenbacteria bacterium]|uniref:DNA-3-methyladenine glycosylase I n=1 Tax=marine sediment metagenome TaxID=412755 RepID=A0A0F9G5N4_9ZZZZ|nr:DNA-3-methyladenine glycosylase I [Candidatus Jorgensenbacteria bacterium]
MQPEKSLDRLKRCWWLEESDTLMTEYHDNEWGIPLHDDRRLFEVLILDGAQAGLSWRTILNKRENYRKAFDDFDVKKVAAYGVKKTQALLHDKGIVRNKLKIASAVRNAKVFMDIQKEFGSFDVYIWKFVSGKPIQNKWKRMSDLPAHTELSDTISKDLKRRGMNFVGSTIIYAIMQTIGIVNDHREGCFKYNKL